MKKLLAFLLVFCMVFALAGCGAEKEGQGENTGAKAKKHEKAWLVSKVTVIEEDGMPTNYVSEENTYDDNGNLLEHVTYSTENEMKDKTEYQYDKNGYLIEKTETRSDGSWYNYKYTNDKNGNVIKESSGDTPATEYTYDSKNRETSMAEYDSNGRKVRWSTTTYTADGNHSTEVSYWTLYFDDMPYAVDPITTKSTSETDYNSEGRVTRLAIRTETEGKNDNSATEGVTTCKYNEHGDEIRCTSTQNGSTDWVIDYDYEYDENGNHVKETCHTVRYYTGETTEETTVKTFEYVYV